ncbi:proton-coupled amino acid transporter 1 isoform X2 [Phymastichus coffea]|uniref:proton-coupled amino acid transporter 1 isoform X2 n=1 Tax=Phymastichus coffea TaxID=108790 RepID=UPI00273AE801|nr:proton-coupled amino acid transporter 1 isoform X2 [Phymastichus coffea]
MKKDAGVSVLPKASAHTCFLPLLALPPRRRRGRRQALPRSPVPARRPTREQHAQSAARNDGAVNLEEASHRLAWLIDGQVTPDAPIDRPLRPLRAKMELHTKRPSQDTDRHAKSTAKDMSSNDTLNGNGNTYGAFQSKDPILQLDKDVEARVNGTGGDGHGGATAHTTGYIETLMHHFKGNVGSGIFALGDAFKNAGLALAPPLTIFLGFICIHAQHILLNCNDEVQRRLGSSLETQPGYAATVELCFATGPLALRKYSVFMRKLVNLFLCVTQLGFCCVYFVFISTNMQQVMSVWGIELDLHLHMAIVLVPIMFSTWIRNLKFLVPLSSLANFLIIAGYAATIYIMCHDLPAISERRYVADWNKLPLFFGTVIYSFEGITLVLPLKNEMKKPRNFDKPLGVLNVGMVIVGMMFVVLGFLAYLKYGDDIQGSVTLNLEPKADTLPQCIKLAISLSILLTYALQFYVPIAIMWPEFERQFGPCRWPVASEIMFRTTLCFITFVLAEAIPKLGLFISLVGAVSSTALALLFPPIIEIVVCWQNASMDKLTITKDIVILTIGLLGCATGTYESVSQIIKAFSQNL